MLLWLSTAYLDKKKEKKKFSLHTFASRLVHKHLEENWQTDQLKYKIDILSKNTSRTCGSSWLRQIGIVQREEWNPNFIRMSQQAECFKVKWGMKGHCRHGTHYLHTQGAHQTDLMAADRTALEWCWWPFTQSPYQHFYVISKSFRFSQVDYYHYVIMARTIWLWGQCVYFCTAVAI